MIADFMVEHPGVVLGVFVTLMIGALIGAGVHEDHQRDAACARMWAATRTSSDTVATIAKCDLGPDTQVVPVPIYIPSGR